MTEPKIRRIPCLSDGALQVLRADVLGAQIGMPMVLAWDHVYNALDEIARLREREAEIEHSVADAMEQIEALQGSNATHMARVDELEGKAIAYDLDQLGIELRTAEAVELVELRARVADLELTLSGRTFYDTTDARVVELEAKNREHREEIAGLLGEADAGAFIINNLNAHCRQLGAQIVKLRRQRRL